MNNELQMMYNFDFDLDFINIVHSVEVEVEILFSLNIGNKQILYCDRP
jgi:hypothetical protein